MGEAPNPFIYRLERPLSREQIVAELASLPVRLSNAVAGASEEALVWQVSAESWSAFQVLCHVRDAVLVYAARFRWMIFDEHPNLPNFDENKWVAASTDTPADLPDILNQVAASRADLVRVLTRLPEDGWRRTGNHEAAGTIVLEDYARHKVVHEAMHLEQIREALAAHRA